MHLTRLQEVLQRRKLDAAVFLQSSHDDPNIRYLIGIDTEFCALVIPARGAAHVFTAGFEVPRARKVFRSAHATTQASLDKDLQPYIGKRTAVCFDTLTVSSHAFLKKHFKTTLTDISSELRSLRMIKTNEEIRVIRAACRITDELFTLLLRAWKTFRTEVDAALFLESEMRRRGCEPSFPTIIASGKNSKTPHHHTTTQRLRKGFCVIDFGVRYKGYCSDMTRTIYMGTPTVTEVQKYEEVAMIQKEIIHSLRPEKPAQQYYERAHGALGKAFTHGLGHGIGVQVHEAPIINGTSKDVFQEKMIFTIEPGVYTPHYGIRIEDDILLMAKAEELTRSSKRLIRL